MLSLCVGVVRLLLAGGLEKCVLLFEGLFAPCEGFTLLPTPRFERIGAICLSEKSFFTGLVSRVWVILPLSVFLFPVRLFTTLPSLSDVV